MRTGIVVFPGSNCDSDCWHVLNDVMKTKAEYVWHKEAALPNIDLVILPGGFSYGDYVRTGAIAKSSHIIKAVKDHASKGKPVIGICNGFQILLECELLPGAMLRNKSLKFICKHVTIRTENNKTSFTNHLKPAETLRIPIAHGEGNYFCEESALEDLKQNNQIVFRYSSENGEVADEYNPNGSLSNIAGIMNKEGNVLGMMPHPERASEDILGSDDGRKIWESILNSLK